ncbi:MAG: hypothetical protein SGILL_005913 [Bacillariaceae sp.]
MPRLGGSQTSQSYLISKRNSMGTLPTTNEYAPAPVSGNGIKSSLKGAATSAGMNGLLSPRAHVNRTLANMTNSGGSGSSGGFASDSDRASRRTSRSSLRAAENGKGSLLPDFNAAASTPQTERIRRQPPSRSKSTGATLGLSGMSMGLRGSLSSRGSQQTLPQTQQDLKSNGGGGGGGGSSFSALRRRTATVSDDELDAHSVSSGKRDYRTDSDAFYRSTNRRGSVSSQKSSSSRNGASLWGMSQHGNYSSWTKLGRMKMGNILQVIIVLAVTALVWESHHKALFAAQQLTQFKEEESLLLLHLQKIEQQSIQLHENLGRLSKVGTGGNRLSDGSNGEDGGKVDFDLIHKQTQQLYQMEEELNHEVKTLQTRIQMSARNHIIQEYGEGPVQVVLELDFGQNDNSPNKISILLWHDTPHAAWTWLEQIERSVWNGAEFHWKQGHIIDAFPHKPDEMGSKIEFLEQSHHNHEAWTVGVRESDSGAMGMYINLQDNTNLHKHETCVGKVIDGFDALQRLLEVARTKRDESKNSPIVVRKASATHVTKKEGV